MKIYVFIIIFNLHFNPMFSFFLDIKFLSLSLPPVFLEKDIAA